MKSWDRMKDTIASIDQRLEVTDAFIAVLDNPDLSSDEKLAAFENMAGKMGFTEEMLETVYIDQPEEHPDVEAQLEGNPDMPEPDADSFEPVSADSPMLEYPVIVAPDARPDEDDAFSDIEDAAISSMTYQAEHLMDLVEAICEGDWDSVGNTLMDSYFDKIEAQLSPIEHVADYLNDKFDPEWQADSEAIKESICERLEGISSDTFVDRVCDMAETLSDIFRFIQY